MKLKLIKPIFKKQITRKKFKQHNRFYSQLDMSIIKHDIAVNNARIKRGEILLKGNNEYISVCGCGGIGCFIHGNFKTENREFYR
jgi:hypothetical protein